MVYVVLMIFWKYLPKYHVKHQNSFVLAHGYIILILSESKTTPYQIKYSHWYNFLKGVLVVFRYYLVVYDNIVVAHLC